MRFRNLFALVGAVALSSGCVVGTESDSVSTDTVAQHIVDGEPDSTASVCAIKTTVPIGYLGDGEPSEEVEIECTGVRIGNRLVLTAAHCVYDLTKPGEGEDPQYDNIVLVFGDSFTEGVNAGDAVPVEDVILARHFSGEKLPSNTDNLAVLVLAEDPPASAEIATLNNTDLEELLEPTVSDVRLVGYGPTAAGGGFGALRSVTVPAGSIGVKAISAGSSSTCRGDDGGPVLYEHEGQEVVVAMTGYVVGECASATRIRIDRHTTTFLYPLIDMFDSNCPVDGTCDTDCDRTPDPDCEEELCGWQNDGLAGSCEDDPGECETRDLDCEIGTFPGAECTDAGQCELGGGCKAPLDDESVKHCDQACNPDATEDLCSTWNMVCDAASSRCTYAIPSPRSQGWPCTGIGDCRSGICEEEICVTVCETAADCAPVAEGTDPWQCLDSEVQSGAMVCLRDRVSGGGGFCTPSSVASASSSRNVAGGLFVLFLAMFGLVVTGRRRRNS